MFPYLPDLAPGRKPRPVLIVKIFDDEAPEYGVFVAYGTSQKVDKILSGEFAIKQLTDQAGYQLAGLSFDTKFSFNQTFTLPYNDTWFKPPPVAKLVDEQLESTPKVFQEVRSRQHNKFLESIKRAGQVKTPKSSVVPAPLQTRFRPTSP